MKKIIGILQIFFYNFFNLFIFQSIFYFKSNAKLIDFFPNDSIDNNNSTLVQVNWRQSRQAIDRINYEPADCCKFSLPDISELIL